MSSAENIQKQPKITLVGAGPGYAELITLKAVKALNNADVVLYDALVNEELLNHVFTTGETYRENESIAFVQGDDGMKKFYLDFEYAPLFETDNTISGIFITVNLR